MEIGARCDWLAIPVVDRDSSSSVDYLFPNSRLYVICLRTDKKRTGWRLPTGSFCFEEDGYKFSRAV